MLTENIPETAYRALQKVARCGVPNDASVIDREFPRGGHHRVIRLRIQYPSGHLSDHRQPMQKLHFKVL
jgi:hypothetical protein